MTLDNMIDELEFIKRKIDDIEILGIEETEANMKKLAQAKNDLEYAISELKGIKP